MAGVVFLLLIAGGHSAPARAATSSCGDIDIAALQHFGPQVIRCAYDTTSPQYDTERGRTIRAVVREAQRRSYGSAATALDTTPIGDGLPSAETAAQRLSGVAADGSALTSSLPGAVETLDGATSPSARLVLSDWLKAGRLTGLVPSFGEALVMAGGATMEFAGAALTGWEIGTFLRKTFIETSAEGPANGPDVVKWDAAAISCSAATPNQGGTEDTWSSVFGPDCGGGPWSQKLGSHLAPALVARAFLTNGNYQMAYSENVADSGPCHEHPTGWGFGPQWTVISSLGGTRIDGTPYYQCSGPDKDYPQPRAVAILPDDAQEVDRIRRGHGGMSDGARVDVSQRDPEQNPQPTDADVDNGVRTLVQAPSSVSVMAPYVSGAFAPSPAQGEPEPDPSTVVVPAIEPGETAAAYVARLQDLGVLGQVQVLATPDPAFGPDAAVSTVPASGTRVGLGTTVQVDANPHDAPAPAPATGTGDTPDPNRPKPASELAGCGPSVPAIDLAPLRIGVGDRFPFAVPAWTLGLLDSWVSDAQAPKFTVPFPFADPDPVIDFGWWDGAMPIWRGTMLFVSLVGLAWAFMGMALGFGRGGD